ncbi:MAG: trypsin-like peptidase domain-containing protein [Candidatus Taylorbacteria bacterium]|nr:trypsin-like peptidase domain-containing protein [Candidatus Taylorbacteria bacterium]
MPFLIKLVAYLIGVVALLFVIAPPQKHGVPIERPREEAAQFIATSSASRAPAKGTTATSTAKIATTTDTAKVKTKKPSAQTVLPLAAAPMAIGASPATTTASASSSPLSTLNPARLDDTGLLGGLKLETAASADWSAINQKARAAIINIICTSQTAGLFEPLSGSGVVIDQRGIIITNAHIGQYFLLKDYRQKNFLTCVARTGSPAKPAYTLKLLYLSSRWLQDNYKNITAEHPTGTGENDFALLQIASSTNPDLALPPFFPALATEGNEDGIKTGNSVVLASYPAGFLGGIAIQRDLYIVSSIVNIGRRFTFKEGTLDAFSLGGSPVAQRGSSGGAVVNAEGKLLGIIVTSTDAKDTADRNLDAISIAHINRSLAAETNLTLDSLLASSLENFSAHFETDILPDLKKLLLDEVNSKNP